jgi:hypothetical protein
VGPNQWETYHYSGTDNKEKGVHLINTYRGGKWKNSVKTGVALAIAVILANVTDPAHVPLTWFWWKHILIACFWTIFLNEARYWMEWLNSSNGENNEAQVRIDFDKH